MGIGNGRNAAPDRTRERSVVGRPVDGGGEGDGHQSWFDRVASSPLAAKWFYDAGKQWNYGLKRRKR